MDGKNAAIELGEMEVPTRLRKLYKHWENHSQSRKNTPPGSFSVALVSEIESFATERMRIWELKQKGRQRPYTKDSVLDQYRFCNIYRELDRQTIEIHGMLKDIEDDFPLWLLNVAFIRFVCKPETVRDVGLLSFDKAQNKKVYKKLLAHPRPKYGNAYVFPISVIQRSSYPTREEFFCYYLPKVIPEVAKLIQTFDNLSVVEALGRLLPVFGFNFRFHWTEILIDVAYQYPQHIDLYKQFPIGPGSAPTMKRLSQGDPELTCLSLLDVEMEEFPYLEVGGKRVHLSAENWEGIGCEFRKYSNLSKGTGRVRRYR